MPAPAGSLAAPGRPDIWLKPVGCGVTFVGVLLASLLDEEAAIPLYIYFIKTSNSSLPQIGRAHV